MFCNGDLVLLPGKQEFVDVCSEVFRREVREVVAKTFEGFDEGVCRSEDLMLRAETMQRYKQVCVRILEHWSESVAQTRNAMELSAGTFLGMGDERGDAVNDIGAILQCKCPAVMW